MKQVCRYYMCKKSEMIFITKLYHWNVHQKHAILQSIVYICTKFGCMSEVKKQIFVKASVNF